MSSNKPKIWRSGSRLTRWLPPMIGAFLVFVGCGEGDSQACHYTTSSNWPSGATFTPYNPASCPIKTPPGGREQYYSAQSAIINGTTTGSASLDFYSFNSGLVNVSVGQPLWSEWPGGVDVYTFIGTYDAGTVAPPGDTTAYDTALNQMALASGGSTSATVKLRYQNTRAAGIIGTHLIAYGQSATLSGEYYQSDLLPPISYQWYQDGSPISGATGTTLEIYSGEANTSSTYQFRTTDSENRMVSANFLVTTSSACGPPLLEC